MNTVKTEHCFSERVLAFILVLMMFFMSIPESLFSVSAEDDEFQISIKWNHDDPNNYIYESSSPEIRDVHLEVSFSNKKVSEAYAPGELIITVPGIKDAVRSGNSYIASSVAADKEGSGSKIYNWSYSYTEATDTYTFTNNFTVEKQSVFEGTFEIVWSLPSRETIDKLKNLEIQAEMFIPGKGENSSPKTIQSNTINYSQTRKKDEYKLNITHTSLTGIKKSETEKDLKVVYDIGCSDDYKSKDVFTDELFEFWFLEDATVSGGGLVETDETKNDFADDENTYKKYTYVKNITNTNPLSLKDIVVVYPGKYNGETVTVYGYAYGKYYEEDYLPENTIVEKLTDAKYPLALNVYDYEDIPGDVYDVTKESYGIHNMTIDQEYADTGAIDSANLTDGKGDYYSDLKIRLKFHSDRGYTSHDLEFVDDILDVQMKDGNIYQLTDDEYHFTKIRIPPKSEILDDKNKPITGNYSIVIKGRKVNTKEGEFNVPLGEYTLSDKEQIIEIKDNDIVGISVCFKSVTENIGYLYNPNTSQTMVRCYYAFHMKKETVENIPIPGGHVINNMFFKRYDNYDNGDRKWANTGYTYENGEYSTDREYQRDFKIYGEGVDREKDDTPIIEIPNEFSIRQVKLESLANTDSSAYKFNGLIEGSFNLGEGTSLENFSMYMIVPEGLRIEEMYNNPDNLLSKLNFSASNGMTSAYIASHVEIEILQGEKYNGRQYIQFHFDFSDNPIQTKTLMINGIPMYADKSEFEQDKSYNYTLHGALLVNQGGKWNSRHTDSYAINGNNDIDDDGDIEEPADFASHNIRFTFAVETYVALKKYVKTPLTNGLVSPEENEPTPKTYVGGDYSYILKASVSTKNATESGGATNIIFADVIESKTQDNSEWQGEFVGIDYSKALAQLTYSGGTKPEPTIYYSTEEFAFAKEEGVGGAEHNKFDRDTFTESDKWTKTKPTDAKQIRAVAVDFGEGLAAPGTTLQIEIKMKAPESSENFNKIARNKCSISYEKIDASGKQTEEHLDSNIVPVTYVAKGKIVLTKKDEKDKSVITGATFKLYKSSGSAEEDKEIGEYTVDQNGRLVINDLEYGDYYFKEITAPKGYELDATKKYEVKVGEGVTNIIVENKRKPGTFSIQKVSDRQPKVTLQGAEFSLYKSNGELVKGGYITGADGKLKLENLEWGSYYLKETKAPDGYKISDEKIEFTINADNNAGSELGIVTVKNEQIPAKAKLVKYELAKPYDKVTSDAELNTKKPLKGAVYALYKEDEPDNPITRKVTDKDGAIYVEDLTFGKYYFQEISAPAGYKLYEKKISFEVTAEHTKAFKTVQTADSRKTGTVSLTKTATGTGDAIHAATKVGNAVYRLYLSTDTAFANPLKLRIESGKYHYDKSGETTDMLTDETEGFIEIFDLPWNSETDLTEKYVLKEYKAPKGYSISNEKFEFRIDASTVSKPFIYEDEDEQKTGTVKLVKTDSTGKLMEDVKFTLYREDGSIYLDDITTKADGTAEVEKIPWGSYYFLEKKATTAGLNDKKFRFVVNQDNAGRTQEIQIEDPVTSFQFTVTKKIKKSDIIFEHGNPTFIFEAKNTEDDHIYRKAVAFNEDSLNIVGDYVTASVIFVVPTGKYEVSEVSVNRYQFKGITVEPAGKTGVTVDNSNKKVEFTLNNETKDIEFIFENDKIDQSGTSDSDLVTNTLNKDRTLISIAAEYTGGILMDDVVSPADVTVYAFYDNGTQEELKPTDGNYPYTIGPVDAGMPNEDQLVEVSYTEGSITRTDFISVKTDILNLFKYTVMEDESAAGYDGVISIYQYTGKASIVKFPASLTVTTEGGEEKTYKVKAVAAELDDWGYPNPNIFKNYNDVTSVIFAEGIEEIGKGTFRDAYGLKNVELSASIKKIGDNVFNQRNSLESLTIPEDSQLEEIGESAFYNVKMSGELKLPASLKTIGTEAFDNCSALTSLEFELTDSKLETIGNSAFSSCMGLSGDLTIPKNVTTIGDQAFESAYASKEPTGTLKFEDGSLLTTIGNYAFGSCGFATVDFGKQGTQELTIGRYAFQNCKLKNLILSDNVTTINDGAFDNCANLGSLNIPNSVKTIGNNAFEGCTALKNLTFEDSPEKPSQLTSIGNSAFKNGDWSADSEVFLSCELTLPASLQKIGDNAFRCTNITKLTFNGNNLTDIGSGAFGWCKSLAGSLTIPDSVEKIGDRAFAECNSLNGTLKLSNKLTEIKMNTFFNCQFTGTLDIPESVEKIGYGVFSGGKYTQLILHDGLKEISVWTEGTYSDAEGHGSFTDCSSITGNIIIPKTVTTIGELAFSGCNNVTKIYYPSSVTPAENAFANIDSGKITTYTGETPTT